MTRRSKLVLETYGKELYQFASKYREQIDDEIYEISNSTDHSLVNNQGGRK